MATGKWLLLAVLIASPSVGGCDREEAIAAGYVFTPISGRTGLIVREIDGRKEFAVDPNVTRYERIDGYIVGIREVAELVDDPGYSRRFGYFLLDIESGELVEGLGKEDFEAELRKRRLGPNPF